MEVNLIVAIPPAIVATFQVATWSVRLVRRASKRRMLRKAKYAYPIPGVPTRLREEYVLNKKQFINHASAFLSDRRLAEIVVEAALVQAAQAGLAGQEQPMNVHDFLIDAIEERVARIYRAAEAQHGDERNGEVGNASA